VAKEELRLEAYRRLAAVTSDAEVDDIRNEWVDRFGPLPPAAEQLLEVALLRAECSRLGIREVSVVKGGGGLTGSGFTARLAPLDLKVSQRIRLDRLYPKAVHKETERLLVVPVPGKAHPAQTLVELLRTLVPPEAVPQDVPAGV
jgi:transcription-repair coupling factor (superfamily II helicase)